MAVNQVVEQGHARIFRENLLEPGEAKLRGLVFEDALQGYDPTLSAHRVYEAPRDGNAGVEAIDANMRDPMIVALLVRIEAIGMGPVRDDPGSGLVRGLHDQSNFGEVVGLDIEHGAARIGGQHRAHERDLFVGIALVELQHILFVAQPHGLNEQTTALVQVGMVGLSDFAHRIDEANVFLLAGRVSSRSRAAERHKRRRPGEQYQRVLSHCFLPLTQKGNRTRRQVKIDCLRGLR